MAQTPQNPWGNPTGWGTPDDGRTREFTPLGGQAPQDTQSAPSPAPQYPQPPQQSGGGNGGLVAAVVAAVCALLVLGGVIWFVTSGGDDSGTQADGTTAATAPAAPATVTVTQTPDPAPTPAPPAGGSTGGGTTGTTGTTGSGSGSGSTGSGSTGGGTAGSTGTTGSGSGSLSASATAAGLSWSGWSGYPDATCNADDTWVYAGGDNDTKVVVCRVGRAGDYYYRGYAGGQGLERDVDMSSADVASGYFVVDASPSTIVIDGDDLTVRNAAGAVTKHHTFSSYWVGR